MSSTLVLLKLKRPLSMHVCTHVHVPYPSRHTRVPYCHISPPPFPVSRETSSLSWYTSYKWIFNPAAPGGCLRTAFN